MTPAFVPSNIPRKQSRSTERLNKIGHHRYRTRISPSSISNLPETLRTSVHLASEEHSPPLPHRTDDDPPDPIDPYGSRIATQSAGRRTPGGPNRLATRKSKHAPAERKNTLPPKPSQPEEPPIEPYGRGWEPWRPGMAFEA